MIEERVSGAWTTLLAVTTLCIAAVAVWFFYTLSVLSHDKTLNGQLQDVWANPRGVPLRVVVPPNNTWMDRAFVADVSSDRFKGVAVLILDDHYRSRDPTYRSDSGVVGDPVSHRVLCSVPEQARAKKVVLDAVVARSIDAICGKGR
jgi:hypothetical protein